MELEPQLHSADFAILRLSLRAQEGAGDGRPPVDFDDDSLRAYLARVGADPLVREAIAVSSLPLDETLDRLAAGFPVRSRQLRGGTVSAARYLLRMRSRATPFGIMAGVAAARFEDRAQVRIGASHGKLVRPDRGWLHELVRRFQGEPAVLAGLRVVANDLCAVRGERLVLPRELIEDAAGQRVIQRGERPLNGLTRRAIEIARTPIVFGQLAGLLAAEYPAEAELAETELAQLVEEGYLLTELLPPATCEDPLGHIIALLTRIGERDLRASLLAVRAAMGRYEAAAPGSGYPQLRALSSAMQVLQATDRPIHVDLAFDANVALPRAVAEELESSTSAAWRLAKPQPNPLASYLGRFRERYGTSALVPIKELLDPHAGLGSPTHAGPSPGHPSAPGRAGLGSARESALCGLAQRAAARHEREVVLDNALLRSLAGSSDAEEPATYIEVCGRLLADSPQALERGEFRIVLGPPNYTRPGAMFGRFLSLLPKLRDPFSAAVGELSAGWSPASTVHLVGANTHASADNVSQLPQLGDHLLAVGVFADSSRPQVLRLDDVAIGARPDGLYAVSLRTGEELVPLVFHANEMRSSAPTPIWLLFQLGLQRTPRWRMWDWGAAAAHLPFLPRIRYGRTVLSSARWLPDPELLNPDLGWARWRAAADRWREVWEVPDRIEAGMGDWLLPLELDSDADLRVLRDELRRRGPNVVCLEEPTAGGFGTGWADGHTVEVAVALRPRRTRPDQPPAYALPAREAADAAAMRPVFRPGGEWLYLKCDAAIEAHQEILARYLSELLDLAEPLADRWFFARCAEPGPQLRLHFHGTPYALNTQLAPRVHAWADRLARAGLLGDLALATYRPDVAGYGGPKAVEAAEVAFCADSRAVVGQLDLRHGGQLTMPIALLGAANCLDLAERLHGPGWQDWLLANYPRTGRHRTFQRHRSTALALLDAMEHRSGLSAFPGIESLFELWERRGPQIGNYGRRVRELADQGGVADVTPPFRRVLGMHLNRLAGTDPLLEQDAYALARGVLQARADRAAAAGRQPPTWSAACES